MRSKNVLLFLLLSLLVLAAEGKKQHTLFGECIPSDTDYSTYHCYPRDVVHNPIDNSHATDDEITASSIACIDSNTDCPRWASENECSNNPRYMSIYCRNSCGTCVDGHRGVTQIAPDPTLRDQVLQRVVHTAKYLHYITIKNINAIKTCHNEDPYCTYWAVRGECERNSGFMHTKCSAACNTCDLQQNSQHTEEESMCYM